VCGYQQGRKWGGVGVLPPPRLADSKWRQNGRKVNILNEKEIFCPVFFSFSDNLFPILLQQQKHIRRKPIVLNKHTRYLNTTQVLF